MGERAARGRSYVEALRTPGLSKQRQAVPEPNVVKLAEWVEAENNGDVVIDNRDGDPLVTAGFANLSQIKISSGPRRRPDGASTVMRVHMDHVAAVCQLARVDQEGRAATRGTNLCPAIREKLCGGGARPGSTGD